MEYNNPVYGPNINSFDYISDIINEFKDNDKLILVPEYNSPLQTYPISHSIKNKNHIINFYDFINKLLLNINKNPLVAISAEKLEKLQRNIQIYARKFEASPDIDTELLIIKKFTFDKKIQSLIEALKAKDTITSEIDRLNSAKEDTESSQPLPETTIVNTEKLLPEQTPASLLINSTTCTAEPSSTPEGNSSNPNSIQSPSSLKADSNPSAPQSSKLKADSKAYVPRSLLSPTMRDNSKSSQPTNISSPSSGTTTAPASSTTKPNVSNKPTATIKINHDVSTPPQSVSPSSDQTTKRPSYATIALKPTTPSNCNDIDSITQKLKQTTISEEKDQKATRESQQPIEGQNLITDPYELSRISTLVKKETKNKRLERILLSDEFKQKLTLSYHIKDWLSEKPKHILSHKGEFPDEKSIDFAKKVHRYPFDVAKVLRQLGKGKYHYSKKRQEDDISHSSYGELVDYSGKTPSTLVGQFQEGFNRRGELSHHYFEVEDDRGVKGIYEGKNTTNNAYYFNDSWNPIIFTKTINGIVYTHRIVSIEIDDTIKKIKCILYKPTFLTR